MIDLLILGSGYKKKGKCISLVGTTKSGKTFLGILEFIRKDFIKNISRLKGTLESILTSIEEGDHIKFLRNFYTLEDFYEFKYIKESLTDFLKKYRDKARNFSKKHGVQLKGRDIIEDTYLAISSGVLKEYLRIFKTPITKMMEVVEESIKSLEKSYSIEVFPVKVKGKWVTLEVIPGEYTKNPERLKNSLGNRKKVMVVFGPLDFYGHEDVSLDIFLQEEYEFLEILKDKETVALITMADDEFLGSIFPLYIWRDNMKVDLKKLFDDFLRRNPIYKEIIGYFKGRVREFFKENIQMNPSEEHWNNVIYELTSILIALPSVKGIYYVSSLRKKGRENFKKALMSLL